MSQQDQPSEANKEGLGPLFLALLVIAAFLLRTVSIDHGMPRNYVRDADFPHAALGILKNRDPWPPRYSYSRDPHLLPILMIPVLGAEYVVGKTLGEWSDTESFGSRVLEYPALERMPGRVLVAIFGALTVLVAFRIARRGGLGKGAWVAGYLVATSLLHTHFSMQERVWVPMIFFIGLTIWASAKYMRDGKTRPFLLSCLCAGLAHSTMAMPMGRLVLGICGLAWILGPLGWGRRDLITRGKLALLGLVIFNAAHLLLGSAYLWRHSSDHVLVAVGREFGLSAWTFFCQGELLFGGRGLFSIARVDSLVVLGPTLFGHDPVLVLLGVPGLLLALRRRSLLPGTLFALGWMCTLLLHRNGHVEHVSPLTLLLAVPAAFSAEWILKSKARWTLALLLLVPAIQHVRYLLVMSRPDTRELAELRLAELPSGGGVAVGRFGPAPEPNLDALERLARIRSRGEAEPLAERGRSELSRKERNRLLGLERGESPSGTAGLDVLALSEIFVADSITAPTAGLAARHQRKLGMSSRLDGGDGLYQVWRDGKPRNLKWPEEEYRLREGMEKFGDSPGEVLEALGIRYLLVTEFNPASAEEHPLHSLTRGKAPVWVIDPGSEGGELREARLPLEMEFAATHIWKVERPGPRLLLYDLR